MSVKLSFSHVGLFVHDLPKMVDFYTRILGLVVSGREVREDGSEIAFMTGDPREHHHVVLCTGRPEKLQYNMIQQISFRAPSLAVLRETYVKLTKEPIEELGPVTHGNAISTYFRDPEGNRLEKSDEELLKFVEDSIRGTPGFVSRAEWTAEIAAKLAHSHKH